LSNPLDERTERSDEMSVLSDQATTQATQRWVVDRARSTVEFRVRNFWG
jgi:polyisoprenoid-binding protein YceI